jgi:SAM-dependent methyltransferase
MTHYDATRRFTNRVDNYVKYRPSYPRGVIDVLIELGLGHASQVADVGSGTGILTELLLEHVAQVYAVEPNNKMRAAAEARLDGHDGFVSIPATAEATTLDDHSVDMVVAAQAFHWFDTPLAIKEFRRILREPRRLALIWNDRLSHTPFLKAYESLLESHGTDYREVNHRQINEGDLPALFTSDFRFKAFDNQQQLDLEGIKGRLFSSSYTPTPGDPQYGAMLQGIEDAFRQHQVDGQVTVRYKTKVYSGII